MAVLPHSDKSPGQVKKVCRLYELPQYRVALLLGCSRETLWRIAAGRIEPTDEQALLLGKLRQVAKAKPNLARRIRQVLVSSGRLDALSLLLRTSQLKR